MRKIILGLFVGILALAFLSACNGEVEREADVQMISGDYIQFSEIDGLYAWATYVVRAEILSERVEVIDTQLPLYNPYIPFTLNSIKILEVFSGNLSVGDIRDVWQMGGEYDGASAILYGGVSFSVGEELILFLAADYTNPNWPLSLVNPSQAVYRSILNFAAFGEEDSQYFSITQAYYEDVLDANIVLQSVNESNEITLTLGDLMRITGN